PHHARSLRPLLSFPTRRSSDLCRRRVQLMAMVMPLLLLTLILKAPISPLRQSISALPALLGATVEVHVWGVPALPTSWTGMLLADRKSTRLNSSHVSISYAVFC